MSSPETDNMAALAERQAAALARLERSEGALFRFTHQVRAFLAVWPDDMPTPVDITPTYQDREDVDTGEMGGKSYLHLTYMTRQGVEAWAARWGTDIARDPGGNPAHWVHVTTECCVDGLRVLAACMEYPAESAGGDA